MTLDLTDEGHLVYEMSLVAQGAVPYRDFQHVYGPSVFFWNGALLWLFGPNLLVIRISLVLLKACVAVLVYMLARRVSRRPFALAAYVCCVVVWGAPWWLFNTPYANHYSSAFILLGLVVFLAMRRRFMLACLAAGLSFGMAATFKHTVGAFAFGGFGLFLLYADRPVAGRVVRPLEARTALTLRLVFLVGTLALFVGYTAQHLFASSTLVLLTPILVTTGLTGTRELQRSGRAALTTLGLRGVAASGLGMALPLVGYVGYYVVIGAGWDLFHALVYGLPQTFRWFFPLEPPGAGSVALGVTMLAGVAAVRAWRTTPERLGLRRVSPFVGWLAVFAVGSVIWMVRVWRGATSTPGSVGVAWESPARQIMEWMPIVALYVSGFVVMRRASVSLDQPESDPTPAFALALLYFVGAATFLELYPAAEEWHLLMWIPLCLPLVACGLDRLCGDGGGQGLLRHYTSCIIVVVFVAYATAPFVRAWASVVPCPAGTQLSRAPGICDRSQNFGYTVQLVRYLERHTGPGDKIFTIAANPMLYFLAGRRSAADKDEFALYMIEMNLEAKSAIPDLVNQGRLVARLAVAKPLIIDNPALPASARIKRALPDVARYIGGHYTLQAQIGPYRLLRWYEGK